MKTNGTPLRERIVNALQGDDFPSVARFVNVGALEDELWTKEEWQDSYSDDLACELKALEDEGVIGSVETMGTITYYINRKGDKDG